MVRTPTITKVQRLELSKELPRSKGHYVLVCRLKEGQRIRVGALGDANFRAGFYAYVGSALGGLAGRLRRHLGPPASRPRWHIDCLLQHANPLGAVWGPVRKGKECPLAEAMAQQFARINGFGATDCRCPGHLFHSQSLDPLVEGALEAFLGLRVESKVLWRIGI